METKLIALRAEKEMLKVVVEDEHKKLLADLTKFIQEEMATPTGAVMSRLNCRIDFHDELEVNFEMGFLNEDGKQDFGSDCWFECNLAGLSINHGTIGCWTKQSIYQIKRIKMLSYIVDILPQLENSFKLILDSHKLYVDKQNELWALEAEIKKTEREISKQAAAKMMESIVVGSILCYPDTFHPDCRLFATNRWLKQDDFWSVTKIAEKTIQLESQHSNVVRRVNREKLQEHIANVGLKIINNGKEVK